MYCAFCLAGVVHWAPPQQSLDAASQALERAQVHSYGPASGMPELVTALETKVATDNRLQQVCCSPSCKHKFVSAVGLGYICMHADT